ncbi:MAG TPA: hypothetical protein VH092_04315 [Urbifossiella sp.]|jgi:hypothetical protein|nr:hypothetical protein [Urbifossiella sp.]
MVSTPAGGGTFFGNRAGRFDQGAEWFPVRLTGIADPDRYTGYEVWIDPAGATVEVVGRRVLTADQPGIFLDGPVPSDADLPVVALARLGPGSGGRTWDLFGPFLPAGSGSGAGAGPGGACDLETVRFDVVTDVDLAACTVTRQRVAITGCNLSLVVTDIPSGGG